MNRTLPRLLISIWVLAAVPLLFTSCETPNAPSFETEQVFTIPIVGSSRYPLLGGAGAIIDTTRATFENLFTTDEEDLLTLGFESPFLFGEMGRVLPGGRTGPAELDAPIPAVAPGGGLAGTLPLAAVSGRKNPLITLEVTGFQEARALTGSVVIELLNDSGAQLEDISATLIWNGQPVGQTQFSNALDAGQTLTLGFEPAAGQLLAGSVQLQLGFEGPAQSSEGTLRISGGLGDDFLASSAISVMKPVSFLAEGEIPFESEQFAFSSPDDFIGLDNITLQLENIINELDLALETVEISFPTIFRTGIDGSYQPSDTLVVRLTGSDRILRSSLQPPGGQSFTLNTGPVRIFTENGQIPFRMRAVTEDTRSSSDPVRDVSAGEQLRFELAGAEFSVNAFRGLIKPRFIPVTSPNEQPDLGEDEDTEAVDFADLEFLARRFNSVDFVNPRFQIMYETNLQVPANVYLTVAGTGIDGQVSLLESVPGSPFRVNPADSISGFTINGEEVNRDQILVFPLEDQQVAGTKFFGGSFELNNENSGIRDFLRNLPVETDIAAIVLPNPDGSVSGSGEAPAFLEGLWNVTIPFSLVTEEGAGLFTDSLGVSLADLPGPGENLRITNAELTLTYRNRLPLDLDLRLQFIDSEQDSITSIPKMDEQTLRMLSAPVNDRGFSIGSRDETVVVSFTGEQLEQLNQTREIVLSGEVLTRDFKPVSLRGGDNVNITLSARFTVRSGINP